MTQNPEDPQNESLLARIVKTILPFEEEEDLGLPTDEATFWSDCKLVFQSGLAFGVLKPDLARRLLEEIISESAEQEWPWLRAVQFREGGQLPALSDADNINRKDMEDAAQQLAEFVRGKLGL